MREPAAVMINLLGASAGPGMPYGWQDAIAVPGAFIHIYGKTASVRGRKMGHITAVGASIDAAFATASKAAQLLRFGDSI